MIKKIFIKILPMIINLSVKEIVKLNLTTQALEKLWKNPALRKSWPTVCNNAHIFFKDCMNEVGECRKWYESR